MTPPDTHASGSNHGTGTAAGEPRIRPIAICLFTHSGRIFAAEGYDPLKGETFYRPLGGAIEFGETGRDTVVREVREETGLEVKNLHYLFALENIFTFNGTPGHEIVLVYDGELADAKVYDMEVLDCAENDGMPFRSVWKRLDEFGEGKPPLYPDGLLEKLLEMEGKS